MNKKLSDEKLAILLKQGDHSAFTEIYNRYKGILYIHAYKKIRDQEEVDDLIHELFATVWKNRESFQVQTSLSGYLYAAIRNRILDRIAHQNVKASYIQSFNDFQQAGQIMTDHLVRERQLKKIIEREVAALPPKMRKVFELSRNAHLSHKEIAKHMDISEKTVKNQINNALKVLRKRLDPFVFLFV